MSIRDKFRGLAEQAGKYKFTVLILLVGIGLMLVPAKKAETPVPVQETEAPTAELEEQLEVLLRQMDGAGEVEVLLAYRTGMAYEYQTDDEIVSEPDREESQRKTILRSDGGGGEVPVTVSTTYPVYRGALILCQGADSAAVRLDIVHAVSALTGLGSDKISVIKMKGN